MSDPVDYKEYIRTMERRIRALETERQLLEVQRNKLVVERDYFKRELLKLKGETLPQNEQESSFQECSDLWTAIPGQYGMTYLKFLLGKLITRHPTLIDYSYLYFEHVPQLQEEDIFTYRLMKINRIKNCQTIKDF